MNDDNHNSIRALNDAFRQSAGIRDTGKNQIVCTRGIMEQGADFVRDIFNHVRTYNDFNEENDPYGEHDFGIIKQADQTAYWKIDYYDNALCGGSEDPANPDKTARVMTIMLNHEY